MSTPSAHRPVWFLSLAAVLTAGAASIAWWHPFRLGADDWAWPTYGPRAVDGALASLGVYAVTLAVVMALWRRKPRRRLIEVAWVAALVGLAFASQMAIGRQSPAGYQEAVLAISQPGPNRYHKAARAVDSLGPLLSRYEQWMQDDSHALIITHPAGPLSLFWTLNQVYAGDEEGAERFVRWCEDALGGGLRLREVPWAARLIGPLTASELAGAWLATLALRLIASLAVIPTYLLARQLYGRRAALAAGAMAGAVPSLVLFSPGLDQCYPALAALACWLGYSAGAKRSATRAALAGLVVSVGMFFSLVFVVVGGWSVALAIVGLLRSDSSQRGRDAGRLLVAGAAGFAVPVAVLHVAWGYRSVAVWWACWKANAKFNALQGRVYWKWLLINPVEFLAFLGVPAACLLVRRTVGEARALARRQMADRDWALLILVALMVVLNVSGANRAEVARLWMFLMPACVAAAAAELQGYAPYRRAVFAVLFVLQGVQVVLFKASLDTLLGLYRGLGG